MAGARQPATARRTAGEQVPWSSLQDTHVGASISWAWPWDPAGPQVPGVLLALGESAGTQQVVLEPAQYDPDTGVETVPAVTEEVELWTHRVHVDEWGAGEDGDTTLQLRSDAPVTLL
jgi:hypothetical protein